MYEKQFLILNELKTNLMLKFSLQNYLQSFKSLILIRCEGCRYMVILSNKCQMCLLIGSGY